MTLQEAIKILSGTRPASFESDADDLVKALKLGIEALRHEKEHKAEIRKLFEEIEDNHRIYRYALIAGGRKEDTFDIWLNCEWYQPFKERWTK